MLGKHNLQKNNLQRSARAWLGLLITAGNVKKMASISVCSHALQGPLDNLFDHLANPTGVTFATNGVSLPFVH